MAQLKNNESKPADDDAGARHAPTRITVITGASQMRWDESANTCTGEEGKFLMRGQNWMWIAAHSFAQP
jgi:hypothetical protein